MGPRVCGCVCVGCGVWGGGKQWGGGGVMGVVMLMAGGVMAVRCWYNLYSINVMPLSNWGCGKVGERVSGGA